MRHYFWILRVLAAILLFIGTVGFVSDKDLPIMKGKKIVATVNNEPITLDEFNQELATIPQGIVGRSES